MSKGFFTKMTIAIIAAFGILIAGFHFWKPLNVVYFKMKIGSEDKEAHIAAVKYLLEADAVKPVRYYYENKYASKDVKERLAVVDELCAAGDKGKELMREIFRARCMREQVLIPAGSFMMGSEKGTIDERPVHKVTLDAFWMDKYEVTYEKYYVFEKCNKNPKSIHTCPKGFELLPVDVITCQYALDYADWLVMRLPIEAEWEYACRAGSDSGYCFGDNSKLLDEYAWFVSNSKGRAHSIGEKKPNDWGLFDMHGNIWELCRVLPGEDNYNYLNGLKRFPYSKEYILHGGCWRDVAPYCKASLRMPIIPNSRGPNIGFRVCRSAGK